MKLEKFRGWTPTNQPAMERQPEPARSLSLVSPPRLGPGPGSPPLAFLHLFLRVWASVEDNFPSDQ